jgi:hypothetical protein
MAIEKLTNKPTEADLEAEIHAVLATAFPWLQPGDLQHQTRFSFKFGHSTIEIDGTKVSKAEARSDILIYRGDTPLAVLELKRRGVALTDADGEQGLSYARMLHPRPPLVIISNGETTSLLATHTGAPWTPQSASEEELSNLFVAAGKVAEVGIQNAVEVLLGPTSLVWTSAVRAASGAAIADLSGEWDDPLLPFVSGFSIPRIATQQIVDELNGSKRLVLLDGPPLSGKSCVLRELSAKTCASDDVAVLFVEADGNGGAGVIQSLANMLSDALGWSVTLDGTRTWLRRLSSSSGPALVLVIDGVGDVRDEVRRDIEELTSNVYGPKLRAVLAVDDTIVDRLVLNETGRKATAIGRRAARIPLGALNDAEFKEALRHLYDDHSAGIMPGCHATPEYRVPWLLRTIVAGVVSNPKYQEGNCALLPPLLGLDLIAYARERFAGDRELCSQFMVLARAVLNDYADRSRTVSLVLESMHVFAIRQKTLRTFLDTAEITHLIRRGYLKRSFDSSCEAILIPRLPEILASEVSSILSEKLESKMKDAAIAADWLSATTAKLPFGDVIAAQSIIDLTEKNQAIPLRFIERMLQTPPMETSVNPGTKATMHLLGTGTIDLLFKEDGTIRATAHGQSFIIEKDPDEAAHKMYVNYEPWLILSHVSSRPMALKSEDGAHEARIDPALLLEIGSSRIVLRRPDRDLEPSGVLTHDLPQHGSIVCHKSGIVEPITMSILRYLTYEGPSAREWIEEAISRNSFPLIARIDIALDCLARTGTEWAKPTIKDLVKPALINFPALH